MSMPRPDADRRRQSLPTTPMSRRAGCGRHRSGSCAASRSGTLGIVLVAIFGFAGPFADWIAPYIPPPTTSPR